MKEIENTMKYFLKILLLAAVLILLALCVGCATAPGTQRDVVNVVNRSDTITLTSTNGPTNIVSVSNVSQQGFIKPRWSVWGLIFGDSPTPTAVPSQYSTQNGQPVQQVIVESPYPYNPYGYGGYYGGGYGYGYPYRSVYYGGGGERTLFGYRFRTR